MKHHIDFKTFYMGTWFFIFSIHVFSLVNFFYYGHVIISAVFSTLVIFIAAYEIAAAKNAIKFSESSINANGVAAIAAIHLLITSAHLSGDADFQFVNLRYFFIFSTLALCLLVNRIDKAVK